MRLEPGHAAVFLRLKRVRFASRARRLAHGGCCGPIRVVQCQKTSRRSHSGALPNAVDCACAGIGEARGPGRTVCRWSSGRWENVVYPLVQGGSDAHPRVAPDLQAADSVPGGPGRHPQVQKRCGRRRSSTGQARSVMSPLPARFVETRAMICWSPSQLRVQAMYIPLTQCWTALERICRRGG